MRQRDSIQQVIKSPASDTGIENEIQKIILEILDALQNNRLQLPALPDLAREIHNIIFSPSPSLQLLEEIIASDQVTSLNVIKAANIAAYPHGKQVSSLHDALKSLTPRMVYNIVLCSTISKLFQAHSPLINRKMKLLWANCQKIAIYGYVLAARNKHLNIDEAMLAGLIHEIGTLPLFRYIDQNYPQISEQALDYLIATYSAPIGFRILQSWNYPASLVDVVSAQLNMHLRPKTANPDYVDVITIAKLQAQSLQKKISWRNNAAAERLGHYPGDCSRFHESYAERLQMIANIFGLPHPAAP